MAANASKMRVLRDEEVVVMFEGFSAASSNRFTAAFDIF
jgi:hypothetical protein